MRIVDLSVRTGPGPGEPLPPKIASGIEREYCQIEKLHNLGAVPAATGFTVSCLPVKLDGASAGWRRAAAILDGP